MPKRAFKVSAQDAREFMNRPWHLFVESRLDEERRRFEADPGSAFRWSEELSDDVRHAHGGRIDPWLRDQDFAHHVRLRALLDRAGNDYTPR